MVKKLLDESSILKDYYPDTFDILPIDRSKDYTWHAELPKIDLEKFNKFEFDWESLPEDIKERNKIGKIKNYKYDENC